jgi:hypothetical protein
MSQSLIAICLSGGMILSLVGLALCGVRRATPASAVLGLGLVMWAAGLYAAAPIVRIIALGMFATLAISVVSCMPFLRQVSKSKQTPRATAFVAMYFPMFVPVAILPLTMVGANLNRLLAAQQSPSFAVASQCLAAASVALLTIPLAVALALTWNRSPGRAERLAR